MMSNNRVVLGLSGGVDSAACAVKLKEEGMDVYALYFDVLPEGNKEAYERAKDLCRQLDISIKYINVSYTFNEKIIKPFCSAYENGSTPMPCILCNHLIKWNVLKEYADSIDAYYIATGHYASIEENDNIYYVNKLENNNKDQSYMLSMLGQDILSRAVFPISEFSNKDEVKSYVKDSGVTFDQGLKESQDICFINGDYRNFIKEHGIADNPGNFIDIDGNIIGKHSSYTNFTVGQRKGLGMGFGKPMFVKSINSETADVVLCENEDLFADKIYVKVQSFAKYGFCTAVPKEYNNKYFDVKIRYAAKPARALLKDMGDGNACLSFYDPQRAPARGQFAVLYENTRVIGCLLIC